MFQILTEKLELVLLIGTTILIPILAILMTYRYKHKPVPHREIPRGSQIDAILLAEANEKRFEADHAVFQLIDNAVTSGQLFLQPGFGRSQLMRIGGVDKNRLCSIIRRFAGTNVSGYINHKRMTYAVKLMEQNPHYTIDALAKACGMRSQATFIRIFRNRYDMSPTEYKHTYLHVG